LGEIEVIAMGVFTHWGMMYVWYFLSSFPKSFSSPLKLVFAKKVIFGIVIGVEAFSQKLPCK